MIKKEKARPEVKGAWDYLKPSLINSLTDCIVTTVMVWSTCPDTKWPPKRSLGDNARSTFSVLFFAYPFAMVTFIVSGDNSQAKAFALTSVTVKQAPSIAILSPSIKS